MWTGSIALPRKIVSGQDKEGFQAEETIQWESGIQANYTDVTRSDETLASKKGYTADQNIEVMACNYLGEAFLKDESSNLLYDIKRTYRKDKSGTIILTCQRREDGKF